MLINTAYCRETITIKKPKDIHSEVIVKKIEYDHLKNVNVINEQDIRIDEEGYSRNIFEAIELPWSQKYLANQQLIFQKDSALTYEAKKYSLDELHHVEELHKILESFKRFNSSYR